ncbi:MAG: hypothetical protein H6836_02020 [Planctomycetes bacterium]|nr:hypothetical protein [Planctomycetota bacterium]MCB9888324.1 hypothetical protein [Planctomycetota bacterium]
MSTSRSLISTSLVFLAFGSTSASTVRAQYTPIPYSWDAAFTNDEVAIIRAAMDKVHSLFRDPRVARITRGRYKYASVSNGNWRASGLKYQRGMAVGDYLFHQLAALRSVRFPHVRIKAYHSTGNDWGRANTDRVQLRFSRGRATVSGGFEIELNRYWLGSRGQGSDTNQWAGVIAHEMLHNLGHLHPVRGKVDDEIYRQHQINVFDAAVSANGGGIDGTACHVCGSAEGIDSGSSPAPGLRVAQEFQPVRVFANRNHGHTLRLPAGTYEVLPSGTWSYSRNTRWVGADGDPYKSNTGGTSYPSARFGELLLISDGVWSKYERGRTLYVRRSLTLLMNDRPREYGDNVGYLDVVLRRLERR